VELWEERRAACVREGRYEEADTAAARIWQIKQTEEHQRRKELESQQMAERIGIEGLHAKELEEFNEAWESKCSEFEAHAGQLQQCLADRHRADHQAYLEKMWVDTEPRAPRWSRELLNTRKIQETLVKLKKYAEAADTKSRADELEDKERNMWKAKRDMKVQALEEQFLHKQHLEMKGLLKRIQSSRDEYQAARKAELEQTLQRHLNMTVQLESRHKVAQQKSSQQKRLSNGQRLTPRIGDKDPLGLTHKRTMLGSSAGGS